MLTKAYAALQQFQSQISGITTVNELKEHLRKSKLGMNVWLAVPTVMILDWDVLGDGFSGTLEIQLQPRLTKDGETAEGRHSTLRIESPKLIGIGDLENRLIKRLRSAI